MPLNLFLGDNEVMLISRARHEEFLTHMRQHIDQYECVITQRLDSREAQLFIEGHPGAQIVKRELAGRDLYVLLADWPRPT